MKLKLSEIAKYTGINRSRLSRYARDIFGVDPAADLQSGRSRRFSIAEAFKIAERAYLMEAKRRIDRVLLQRGTHGEDKAKNND